MEFNLSKWNLLFQLTIFRQILFYFFLNFLLYKMCDISGFKPNILFRIDGIQDMYLYLNRTNGRQVKRFETVDQSDRHDGASGVHRALETPCLELLQVISVTAPGTFGENDKILSVFRPLAHFTYDLHGSADIGTIHCQAVYNLHHLLDQDPVFHFLFHNNA